MGFVHIFNERPDFLARWFCANLVIYRTGSSGYGADCCTCEES
jgi:hypothetical protein